MESSSTSAGWKSCPENMHKLFNKNFKQYTPLAYLPWCATYLRPQIFHNLCFSFLLGIAAVPREIEIMLMQIFGGWGWGVQIRCIVGYVQVAYRHRRSGWAVKRHRGLTNTSGIQTRVPSEPVSYAPTHCPQSVQNYQDKLVKLFCIPCTHKSLACVAWRFRFREQSNKGPLSTLPE